MAGKVTYVAFYEDLDVDGLLGYHVAFLYRGVLNRDLLIYACRKLYTEMYFIHPGKVGCRVLGWLMNHDGSNWVNYELIPAVDIDADIYCVDFASDTIRFSRDQKIELVGLLASSCDQMHKTHY